jgi:hypothetical protein
MKLAQKHEALSGNYLVDRDAAFTTKSLLTWPGNWVVGRGSESGGSGPQPHLIANEPAYSAGT